MNVHLHVFIVILEGGSLLCRITRIPSCCKPEASPTSCVDPFKPRLLIWHVPESDYIHQTNVANGLREQVKACTRLKAVTTGGAEIVTAQKPHLRINCIRAQIKKFCTILKTEILENCAARWAVTGGLRTRRRVH